MNRKQLIYVSIALALLFILGAGWYVALTEKENPSVIDNTAKEKSVVMKTYSSEKYGFSLQYPCDDRCQVSPPFPQDDGVSEDKIWFNMQPNGQMLVSGFTDESVNKWNTFVTENPGPTGLFTLSLSSLREALNLPIGSSCKIKTFSESPYTYDNCKIVLIGGKKAVRVVGGIFKASEPNRSYFINKDGDNHWIRITELYTSRSSSDDFLSDPSKITPELQVQIDAMAKMLESVRFE
ncbi:MAG: hypothetical protein Q7S11_00010 [bacterium]|nr:hypothetical protein [bacterium]